MKRATKPNNRHCARLCGFAMLALLLIFAPAAQGQLPSQNESVQSQLIENARRYLPNAEERSAIRSRIERREENFDPDVHLIKSFVRETSNRYHSDLVGVWVHPLRSGASYAGDLLDSGDPALRERAFQVIRTVIKSQDQDEKSKTYGIWPYNWEEPLDQMKKPDWNWADFIGVQLLEIYLKHHDVLPENLKAEMQQSIIHASRSIQRRDVKPTYTNIAVMGTLVTFLTADLFDLPDLKEYAEMRLKRFYDYTRKLGGFTEYNSPNYTLTALNELARMKQYFIAPEALEMVDYCYYTGWEILASHFHPASGQLAGPHSRSYSTLLRGSFHRLLNDASDGKLQIPIRRGRGYSSDIRHAIPEDLIPKFMSIETARVEVDTFDLGKNPVTGYTYLAPEYCIGTANRSTTWEQRRPFVAYWGTVERPIFFRVQLLHDGVDFGIGNIFSVQNKNAVLTGMNFATDGGDYHISLERIKNAKFVAKDVRLRFAVGSTEAPPGGLSRTPKGLRYTDDSVRIDLEMLYQKFGPEKIHIEEGGDENSRWIDWVIYAGEEKEFDLSHIDNAAFAWATKIATTGEKQDDLKAKAKLTDGLLKLNFEGMSLSIPALPQRERDLQSAFLSTRE